ncbi:MAG: sucrase ferredoxin [Actinomycetota bacterium]|nr:sucrase ferredoxin [Actinomycetota bacterium]
MTLTCSAQSLAVDEPLAGTAPVVSCYIVIEQPGAWGREALLESQFPLELGEKLLGKTMGTHVKLLLARHADRLARDGNTDHHVWIAHTSPGLRGMRHGFVTDLNTIADWDFAAISAGNLPPFGQSQTSPVTFVCTHGARDACCALLGRSVYDELLADVPTDERSSVWEISHIGGHRFAPTILTLPSGSVHGRLDVAAAIEMRAEAAQGRVLLTGFRGRSAYPAPLQVAGIAVRDAFDVRGQDAIDVLRVVNGKAVPAPTSVVFIDDRMETEVRHTDGRSWRVAVQRAQLPGLRAESCTKLPESIFVWNVRELEQIADWRH